MVCQSKNSYLALSPWKHEVWLLGNPRCNWILLWNPFCRKRFDQELCYPLALTFCLQLYIVFLIFNMAAKVYPINLHKEAK